MKKLIIILFAVSISHALCGQSLEKIKVDRISGDTTITTKEQTIANPFTWDGHHLAAYFRKINSSILLSFHVKDNFDLYYYISAGNLAEIKFTDGTIIGAKAAFDASSTVIGDTHQVTESYVTYELNNEAIEALKTKDVAFVRMYTTEQMFDYDIKKSKADVIRKQICLLLNHK